MFPCVPSSANELGIALAFETVISLLIYNELTVKRRLFKVVLYTTPSYLIFLDLFFLIIVAGCYLFYHYFKIIICE